MTKVMAKCVWSKYDDIYRVGDLIPVVKEDGDTFTFKSCEDGLVGQYWKGMVWHFERVEVEEPPTTIEEMLGVVEAAGADSAVAATQALHAAGYHK